MAGFRCYFPICPAVLTVTCPAPVLPRALAPPPLPYADYLEEDEDMEEEGMAEDMQESQRQRMLAGRGG